jgi:hypothetical protein
MADSSATYSEFIKVQTITFFDRMRLFFTPLRILKYDDVTVYCKLDAKGRVYIYAIYIDKEP